MAKRTYSANLSVSSLNALKKQLLDYKAELNRKCETLVSRLLESGIEVANAKVGESPLGKYVTLTTNISADKMGCKGILLAKGAVKESEGYAPFSILLAIEFGAGIHYNPTPNPKADEFGLGVGTFPGQIHAFQTEGWMYWDEKNQEWRHTYGVKATMPLYNADIKMIQDIAKIAKEVFS